MNPVRKVYFVSDRTGITAATLANCLLTQFQQLEFERHNIPFIDTTEKAKALIQEINQQQNPLVFCTVVNPEVRNTLSECKALVIDFFDAFVKPLEAELGIPSSRIIGQTHGVSDSDQYKIRIDAIHYALNNDDGISTRKYDKADIIITGVSRSGKTPSCLYLAINFGVFAANYPLTEEDLDPPALPKALSAYKDKLYGLSIDPKRLSQIRQERKPGSRYASLKQCQFEVDAVLSIYQQRNIPYADASRTSIEEIASLIMHQTGLKRLLK